MAESWMYTHRHLYMASDSDSQHLYFPAGPLGYLARSACMAIWLMSTYSFLRMTYITSSIAVVATSLGDPDDWPDMFGHWSDAYTIRRLWGYALPSYVHTFDSDSSA